MMGGYACAIAGRPGTPSRGRPRAHGVSPVCALFNRCQIRHPLPAGAGARSHAVDSAYCPGTPTDRAVGIDPAPWAVSGKLPCASRAAQDHPVPPALNGPVHQAARRHDLSFQRIRIRHLFRRTCPSCERSSRPMATIRGSASARQFEPAICELGTHEIHEGTHLWTGQAA